MSLVDNFYTHSNTDETKRCVIFYTCTNVYITETFLRLTPLPHNLNNPDILIQNQTTHFINIDKTYPGCFGILSGDFFFTFNLFQNFY